MRYDGFNGSVDEWDWVWDKVEDMWWRVDLGLKLGGETMAEFWKGKPQSMHFAQKKS